MKRMLALLALLLVLVPACAMAYTVKYYEWGADTPYFVQDKDIYPDQVMNYGQICYLENVSDTYPGDVNYAWKELKKPEGQTFSHWTHNGKTVMRGQRITEDMELRPVFAAGCTVTLIHANGSEAEFEFLQNENVLLPMPGGIDSQGRTFVGWQIAGTDVVVKPQDSELLHIDRDITLIEVRKEAAKLTFSEHDGTKTEVFVLKGEYLIREVPATVGYNQYFTAWKDEDGNVYVPGRDTVNVTGDMTFSIVTRTIEDTTPRVRLGVKGLGMLPAEYVSYFPGECMTLDQVLTYLEPDWYKPEHDAILTYRGRAYNVNRHDPFVVPDGVDEVEFTLSYQPWKVIYVKDAAPAALPQTGDSSSLALWCAALAIAGAGMCIVRKKKASAH